MEAVDQHYIATLDVGTTTIRCFIYATRTNGEPVTVGTAYDHVDLIYPAPGWVEINPEKLWTSVLQTIRKATEDANLSIDQLTCLAISTQRNSFTCWNRHTGQVYHNFITWKDLRADQLVQDWNNSFTLRLLKFGASFLHFFTRSKRFLAGSVIKLMNPQVTLRLSWVLQNNPALQEDLKIGNVLYGTIDSWLLYRLRQGTDLTGQVEHISDVTNCTSTGFYDPFGQEWAGWALKLFSIKKELLPKVVDNSYDFGHVHETLLGAKIKIAASVSDQSASLWGNCCFERGDVKVTMGTGSFLNVNTGTKCLASVHGLYPLIGYKLQSGTSASVDINYLMEGASNDTGSIIEWALNVGLFDDPAESATMAMSVPNSDGVLFIPAFSGLGPPIQDDTAGSGFIGIRPSTRKEHMVRALLESLAFRVALLYDCALKETGFSFTSIKVDGGVSKNDFICQTLADLTGIQVERGEVTDSTAMGAMFMAGLNCGIWNTKRQLNDGIDLNHKWDRKVRRTKPKSLDVYLGLLVKLYRFLYRRTHKKFNKIVMRRLFMSRTNQPPMSLHRVAQLMKLRAKDEKTIAVVIGTITNDVRMLDVPKLNVCALRVTEKARQRILKNGGKIYTFDQLALISPTGRNTVLMQGKRNAREVFKHFGRAPGVPHSNTRPYVQSKGRKYEKARGRRSSCGFKN
ncbi:putative glycerol kinase 5 isoform X4 [Anopheles stephensi]|uniref:putative glycerol kinase 5 isoform X4 n=1 Tax=Anopheles stephensi TaxID=30069 RepID=UPI0016589879|nr:putative glycerol kinase 5 isoform X4 [Anopheles stephensi]